MNTRYFVALLSALLISGSSAVYAQSFDRDRLVGTGPAGAKQIAPDIAIAPDGTAYVIWADYRDGGVPQFYLARSTDKGETFGAVNKVTDTSGIQAGMQAGPQLVVDRNGVLHLAWNQFNAQQKLGARYARSTDGGLTFSAPIALAADSGLHNQEFPSIAVDSSGNPFVAWIDLREQENGTSDNAQLFVVRSRDGGLTFEPPVRTTYMPRGIGGTCECCNTSIAISRSGNVFVSFRSNIRNDRDIWIARSLDGGATYTPIKAASETWRINACPMTGSSIAVDSDETAHVVWRDSRPSSSGKDYIYYTSLRRADTACAPDRRISTTTRKSNYPSLALSPDGALLVAFEDNRNDASDVYYTTSADGGLTFAPDLKLTQETGTSRQELVSTAIAPDGTRYAVWQDSRQGAARIMLTRADIGVTAVPVAAESLLAISSPHPSPARAGEGTTVDLSIPAGGPVRLVLYDVVGDVAAVPFSGLLVEGTHTLSLDTEDLAPGVYICAMEYAGRRVTRWLILW